MKSILLLLGFLFLFQSGKDADKTLTLQISASQIEIDDAGNFYVLEGPKITMYNPAGDIEYAYSNYYTTNIHSIDISNPDKILLFYKQDQKITMLNQYFRTSPKPFFLKEKGYTGITAACLSDDDNVWVFDAKEQTLIKLTDEGEFITRSELQKDTSAAAINPTFMAEYKGEIYISDAKKGILVFDAIGKYLETLPLKGITHFRINDHKIFYIIGGQAKTYDLKTGTEQSWEMPVRRYKTASFARMGKKLMFYVSDLNKLEVLEMPVVEN